MRCWLALCIGCTGPSGGPDSAPVPCDQGRLQISTRLLDVGEAGPGERVTEEVRLTNVGYADVLLREITLYGERHAGFDLVVPQSPRQLPPGAFLIVEVGFEPVYEGPHWSTLYVRTADFERKITSPDDPPLIWPDDDPMIDRAYPEVQIHLTGTGAGVSEQGAPDVFLVGDLEVWPRQGLEEEESATLRWLTFDPDDLQDADTLELLDQHGLGHEVQGWNEPWKAPTITDDREVVVHRAVMLPDPINVFQNPMVWRLGSVLGPCTD